ncbi:MAG: antitoxin component HigA of HigAB toxin-antitoxin module [Phenylobacterium sp.]|jgi:antitoxin component HigA of HigAB toxin-antitoxin module
MDIVKMKLDSGRVVTIQSVINNDDDLNSALTTLDEIMVNEDESATNQTVVAFIANVIAAYENSLEAVQSLMVGAT